MTADTGAVIDEPTPPPPRSRRVRIELVTAGFFAVLMLGALGGLPFLREAIVESARTTVDRVFPASWAAYYLEVDESETDSRLMFASGSLPGRAARLLAGPVFTGTWSPNGERFIASSGTRLLLGDRDGQVHPLTDLGDLHPTASALWSGNDELLVPVTRDRRQQWLVRLDSRSGTILDQRDLGVELALHAASIDGKWILAADQRTDTGVLYEVATGRRIASGPGESFAAWLGDGRIVTSVVDDRGAQLVARRPEGGASEKLMDLEGIALTPATSSGGRIAVVEGQKGDPAGPRSIWLIAAGEKPVRVATDLRWVYLATPSRDGRYVGFSEVTPGTPNRVRTGIIEIATQRIAYACDAGCAVLDVR